MKLFVFFGMIIFSNASVASNSKIYQLDLFSVFSFALAIAAFVLSIFMAWLSWKFYEKSETNSRETQSSVVKIETAVLGIQSNITEIVRQAVNQWTAGTSYQNYEYNDKLEELSELVKSSSDSSEIQNTVKDLLDFIREQNNNYLLEARAKAIFPSIDTNMIIPEQGAVSKFTQETTSNTDQEKSGELSVEVLRQSRIATVSGKFQPEFRSVPKEFSAELISAPIDNYEDIVVTYGVGKVFDFNVHLRSKSGNLPLGKYVIRYKAKQ